jgi:[mycofactocin precursor peptide]-tyrosine decarboxylase / 3-amino-5-[(4-hydroxyphenyl)methyl]-4,4-dimethylpyrrolidin-2-one synthase
LPSSLKQALTSTRLHAPVNVTWEVTEACNLECSHCLSAGLRTPGQRAPGLRTQGRGELDLAQCRALIDELARMQVFQVNFGGGEPFLRDDFLDILRYTHAAGITTCVSTNGTVLDDALVDELLGMAPVYLQVSLDGACAETNDAIRGRGTFDRIIAGIELLAGRDYPDFSLNMVVTRLNVGEIAEFDRLARRYGAKTRLSRFRPSGAGCGIWDDYRLTREQLVELSAFLGEHPEILTGDSFFVLTPDSHRALGLTMCGAGRMTCAVAPDGSVYPCAFLCEPAFLAGNVASEPLSAIFRSSPVLERFRELEAETCRTCDRFSVCHGGCPAVACFLTGSTSRPDPECLRAVLPAKSPIQNDAAPSGRERRRRAEDAVKEVA